MSVTRPSSVVTLSSQYIAQAHCHVLNLEPICGVQAQTGLLLCSEVDYAMEPSADLTCIMQGEIDERSFPPHHLQLQDPTGLFSILAHVTHVHIQNVGSSAVDIDLALLLVGQTHHIAAVYVIELKCHIA